MSWNKNTSVFSDVDRVMNILDGIGINYELSVIGKVRAMGLNDDAEFREEYLIRRLEYSNLVILETMLRDEDCDGWDYLMSYKYLKENEPRKWALEIYSPDEIEEDEWEPGNNSVFK
jgi:hypothetical protein